MSDERIPCRLEVLPDGEVRLVPAHDVTLRPGESAIFSANPPEVVIHRVWFGRRWSVAIRAYLRGVRGPDLDVQGGIQDGGESQGDSWMR